MKLKNIEIDALKGSVNKSNSFHQLSQSLGLNTGTGTLNGLKRILIKHNIGTDHFKNQIRKVDYLKDTKSCLYCLGFIPYSKNIIHRKFCSKSCSASYNNLRKKEEIPCFNCGEGTKNKKFCNSICSSEYTYKVYIQSWKDGLNNGTHNGFHKGISKHIRRYFMKKCESKCQNCGWGEINPKTGKSPLNLDHIDGNYKNNKEGNLRLLCPNCHSLTPNYGSLNKGNGRNRVRFIGAGSQDRTDLVSLEG